MAGAIHVEANLHLHFRQEWAFTTLGMSRFVSLLAHVTSEWMLATVGRSRFESLTFKKVGQGRRVQFSQLHHLMANVKIYKCLRHYCASSYRFRDVTIIILNTKKQVKVMECKFRNYTIRWQKSKSTHVSHTFLRQLLLFQRYNNFNFLNNLRSRPKLQTANFAITPFDGKCQNIQKSSLAFLRQVYLFQRKIIMF